MNSIFPIDVTTQHLSVIQLLKKCVHMIWTVEQTLALKLQYANEIVLPVRRQIRYKSILPAKYTSQKSEDASLDYLSCLTLKAATATTLTAPGVELWPDRN